MSTAIAEYSPTASDIVSDYIVSGINPVVPSPASLTMTIPSGTAFVLGQRTLLQAAVTDTYPASSDTYFSMTNTGQVAYTSVANGAAAPAAPANAINLLKVVTSASAITTVYQLSPLQPEVKLQNYSGSALTTTGSITSGSAILTLATPLDFANLQGITIAGAGVSGADLLGAQILSGAGTTTLTLDIAASTTVAGATVYHDDTVAIQNALNAASYSFGCVKLPSGTPQISSTLTMTSGVVLEGASTLGTQIQSYQYAAPSSAAVTTFNGWQMEEERQKVATERAEVEKVRLAELANQQEIERQAAAIRAEEEAKAKAIRDAEQAEIDRQRAEIEEQRRKVEAERLAQEDTARKVQSGYQMLEGFVERFGAEKEFKTIASQIGKWLDGKNEKEVAA